MRINGRTIRASTVSERRLLLALGADPGRGLRVRRSANPYVVARRLKRLALAHAIALRELSAAVLGAAATAEQPQIACTGTAS